MVNLEDITKKLNHKKINKELQLYFEQKNPVLIFMEANFHHIRKKKSCNGKSKL